MSKRSILDLIIVTTLGGGLFFYMLPKQIKAHSGRTDSYGCHTCYTNCPSYGLSYGEYHCHGGDTGNNTWGGVIKDPPPPPPPSCPDKEEATYETLHFIRRDEYTDKYYSGESHLKQSGIDGRKETTYSVSYDTIGTSCIEKQRKKIKEVITKTPENEIYEIGTKTTVMVLTEFFDKNRNVITASLGLLLIGLLIVNEVIKRKNRKP